MHSVPVDKTQHDTTNHMPTQANKSYDVYCHLQNIICHAYGCADSSNATGTYKYLYLASQIGLQNFPFSLLPPTTNAMLLKPQVL